MKIIPLASAVFSLLLNNAVDTLALPDAENSLVSPPTKQTISGAIIQKKIPGTARRHQRPERDFERGSEAQRRGETPPVFVGAGRDRSGTKDGEADSTL
mmetsp:Transcript_15755/g.43594  ORF Transcript_15755/g.43594 Transcript_15755/m.43594 type:complete len:99 (+) Transcript_15755:335-631(+)